MKKMATFRPKHFLWQVGGKVARVRLDRPERKNPLTFDSYAELHDTFRELRYAEAVNPPVAVAPSLNGFGLWNAIVLVLMVLAYGYPIGQFFLLKAHSVPAVEVAAFSAPLEPR